MESLEYLKKKYTDIQERSFNTKLELFLFDRAIRLRSLKDVAPEEFQNFQISDSISSLYQKAWQLCEEDKLSEEGITMQALDILIESWYEQQTKLKEELLRQYKALFITGYFPFCDFEELFPIDPSMRVCHYCNITDHEVSKLRSRGRLYTKRQRGYLMEVDRIKPNYEYSKENCVLACYWCNNAKTDEFSLDEFSEHIGPSIETVWKERNK